MKVLRCTLKCNVELAPYNGCIFNEKDTDHIETVRNRYCNAPAEDILESLEDYEWE